MPGQYRAPRSLSGITQRLGSAESGEGASEGFIENRCGAKRSLSRSRMRQISIEEMNAVFHPEPIQEFERQHNRLSFLQQRNSLNGHSKPLAYQLTHGS